MRFNTIFFDHLVVASFFGATLYVVCTYRTVTLCDAGL